MKEQPSYYSILTANVRYDSRLKGDEKVLFSEITALATKQGFCYATNSYFVDVFSNVTKGTISRRINHLKELGYLKIVLIRDENKQIKQRRMYPITDPIINSDDTPIRKTEGDPIGSSADTPIGRNDKGSTTRSFNTTRVNSSSSTRTESQKTETKESRPNAFLYLQTKRIPLSGISQPIFLDYISELGDEVVIHAIDYMLDHGSRAFNYLQQILDSYSKHDIKTVEAALKYEEEYKQKKQQKKYGKTVVQKETVPDWSQKAKSQMSDEERAALKKKLQRFKKKDVK
ncbi:DnaD domain protein [Liquorilactobacillus uvarum]|uniref:DnaD domain protein n=1 Tax=Liquorilactobacillus uvarum TaxID=303240 RepID=UPI002889199F|nr:DnaD domain protein [Liquorilactobacillus uvarum]